MKFFIKFILGLILSLLAGGVLYSLFTSIHFGRLVNEVRPLLVVVFQLVMFCFGLLAMFRQRVVSFFAVIVLLIIEVCFVSYVAYSIAENIRTLL